MELMDIVLHYDGLGKTIPLVIGSVANYRIQSKQFNAIIPITIDSTLDYSISSGCSDASIPMTIDGLRSGLLADYDPGLRMVWDPYTLAEMDVGV